MATPAFPIDLNDAPEVSPNSPKKLAKTKNYCKCSKEGGWKGEMGGRVEGGDFLVTPHPSRVRRETDVVARLVFDAPLCIRREPTSVWQLA